MIIKKSSKYLNNLHIVKKKIALQVIYIIFKACIQKKKSVTIFINYEILFGKNKKKYIFFFYFTYITY
jgi:hypothetical protein